MVELTCMCENKVKADFPLEIDIQKEPSVLESIINGTFMSVTCPKCKKELKPELSFRIIDKTKKYDIQFIPELERSQYLKKPNIRNVNRVVIGYEELVEKIKIIKAELDDRVVEILKYYILSKSMENQEQELDIDVYFCEKKSNSLIFHIKGLRPDEIAVFKMPLVTYNKILMDINTKIKQKPFCDFVKPPYISVNKLFSILL